MALRRDEYGFLRFSNYGQTSQPDLRARLGARPGDQVYRSFIRDGARTSSPVNEEKVNFQPGDAFALGPPVTKAALPPQLHQEWRALQLGGYGQIEAPQETNYGFAIMLHGFALPGGVRTNAMVVLPKDYPITPPIGFYIHESGLSAAKSLGIDLRHLFPDKTHYGAPNFANWGWAWFCLKFQPWQPGHHTLIGIVMMVGAMLAERANG